MAIENEMTVTADRKIINSIYYPFFDKYINIKPDTKHPKKDVIPKQYNKVVFIVSNFIIPAKMIPPNTNLAISIRNLPLSDKIIFFISFSITLNHVVGL